MKAQTSLFRLGIFIILFFPQALCGQLPFYWHIVQPNSLSSAGVAFVELPSGGYFGVARGGPGGNRYIRVQRFSQNGDTLWSRYYYSHNNSDGTFVLRIPAKAEVAPDGGLFILTNNYIPQIEYNAVLRLNAAGDSLWQTTISSVSTWAGIRMTQIKATPDGGCVISGSSQGFPSAPRVVKLNPSGTIA